MSWRGDVAETLARVEPAYWHLSDRDVNRTWGPEAAGLCADAGYVPDDDQKQLLNGMLARRRDGKSVAFEIALIACRRNIKTSTIMMAALFWLFLLGVDPVIWSAHEWSAVDETVLAFENIVGGDPWLRKRVRSFNHAQRDAELVTRNGGRLLFKTRTRGAGRALDGEKIVLDEAWAAKAAHTGSLIPTASARSISGDPQVIYGSSAAHENSEVLHPVISRGRAAARSARAAELERRLMYAEYCAPDPAEACDRGTDCSHALDTPGCGCDKPEMVRLANPAVGRRISMEFILTAERRSMIPAEYGRERMGWHDRPVGQAQVITLTDWADGLDEKSEPRGPVALSVVYSRDKRRAVIGLAGQRADGNWHVEIADYLDSTDLVTRRVRQIIAAAAKKGRQVVGPAVDNTAHEKACIKPLKAARVDVVPMTTGDVTEAYATFYEAATQAHTIRHRGQDELTAAVLGAAPRPVGDAGEAWGRKASEAGGQEIAPIVAVTNALWLYMDVVPAQEIEPGAWAL